MDTDAYIVKINFQRRKTSVNMNRPLYKLNVSNNRISKNEGLENIAIKVNKQTKKTQLNVGFISPSH